MDRKTSADTRPLRARCRDSPRGPARGTPGWPSQPRVVDSMADVLIRQRGRADERWPSQPRAVGSVAGRVPAPSPH